MEKKSRKIYFYAEEYKSGDLGGIRFVGQNGMIGYRAGGNEHKAKFILQVLTIKYGIDAGIKIFNAYNDALLDVSKDEQRNNKKAVLVFYEKANDHKDITEHGATGKSKEDVYGGEQMISKAGKGGKKTATMVKAGESIY